MKRQMEKYFTPMHKSSKDDLKLQKHQDVPHHHPNQHNFRRSSGNSNDFHQYDSQKHPDHYKNFGGTEPYKGQHTTLSSTLISNLFSSSSSSAASLLSESSLDNEWDFLLNKHHHSVSCSNIPEARIFQDEALGNMNFDLSASALSVHQHQHKKQHFGHSEQQQQVPKYRCQSKSVEGLLQSVSQEHCPRVHGRPHLMEFNQLYKTTSLGQNFAVNDKAAASVNMARPKRAVSSIQLPNKGILKNKDEGQKHRNFRKAKSMEALSTNGQSTGPHKLSSVEGLRENVVKEKLEFSAFLDEITRQVICPSRLSSFRINPSNTTTSQKLPHEDRRQPVKASSQEPAHVQKSSKQHSIQTVKSDNHKGRTDSNKHGHKCQTGSFSGVPPYHQHLHSHEKQNYTLECCRVTSHKKHHGKYSQLLNESTSTCSEPILQEKHYQVKGKCGYNAGPSREFNTEQKVSSLPAGLGREIPQKSSTVTAHNSENINKHKSMPYRRHCKQTHRDSVSSLDRAELLEHYNKDLHENLLQMVSCIENIEAELQCTKAELSSIKEKCKRLQDSYTSCQQSNSVLEQKLQSVVDSMNSDQNDYIQKISELTKELDTARNTIISLESITIPSLIKKQLDQHFGSEDAMKNFLFSTSSCSQLDTDKSNRSLGVRENKSSERKSNDIVCDWLLSGQGDSTDRQEHVAAFLPWGESKDTWAGLEKTDASTPLLPMMRDSKLYSVAVDSNSAIYRKIPDAKAKEHVPRVTMHHLGVGTEMHSISMLACRPGEVLSNQYSLDELKGKGEQRTEGGAGFAQQEPDNVTYLTAQKMLDNFISQIPSKSNEKQSKRDLDDRDWTRGPTDGL